MRWFRVLLAMVLLASMVTTGGAAVGVSPAAGDTYVAGELIVGFEPGANPGAVASALSGRVDRALVGGNGFVLRIHGNPKAMAAVARALPGVTYAEPNWIRTLHDHSSPAKPNDTDFGIKWDLHNDGTLSVGSDYATHGADVNWLTVFDQLKVASLTTTIVAILDTGIDASHPDLDDKLVGGYDFISNDSVPQDGFGHGTHVAGIAAAETNNATGTAGVGFHPAIKIMAVKVCDDNGSCPSSSIASGIRWAADNGAKVINMSFGGTSISTAEQDAINYAHGKGVLMVASAGNSNVSTENFPAAYEPVMAIAATNWDDGRASYSNYGAGWVDLAAPGGQMSGYDDIRGIYSTMPTYRVYLTSCRAGGLLSPCYDRHYDQLQGTSMAAPQVAGAAALLFAMGVKDATTVRNLMEDNAAKIPGTSGVNGGTLWANGRLDLGAAVAAVAPPLAPGSISGTVIDLGTGLPIGGALVSVDGTEMSATTTTDGTYSIASVPVGVHTVTAAKSGYVSDSESVTVAEANNTIANFSLSAEPPPLAPGSISGTVIDFGTGLPIGGAMVSVGGTALSAITAANGSYSISSVPVGTYTVTASAEGYESASKSVTVGDGETVTADFTLDAQTVAATMHVAGLSGSSTNNGGTWTGDVTILVKDSNGVPVGGVTVTGDWSNGTTGSSNCVTNSSGVCTVSKSSIPKRTGSVTFTVKTLGHGSLVYDPGSNVVSSIVVSKP